MTDAPGRILILIKPDAVRRRLTGEILRRIEAKGYDIVALDRLVATPDVLAEHYVEHVGKSFYPSVVEYMTSGPLVSVVVEGHRVIEGLRSLIGATDPTAAAPGTIRGDLGRDWGGESMMNLIHGSDSAESANREITLWFPEIY